MSEPTTRAPTQSTPVVEVVNKKTKPRAKGKKRGNKPGNNGRRGYRAPKTLERLVSKKLMVQRIVQATDSILNAQLNKARGETFLMVRGHTGKGRDRKAFTEIVTSLELIKEYVIDDGATLNSKSDDYYYYISRKPADNLSMQNLLDRAYGRPTEKVELGERDDGDLEELSDEELQNSIDAYLERRRAKAKN